MDNAAAAWTPNADQIEACQKAVELHNKKLADVPENIKAMMNSKPPMTDDEKKERKATFQKADSDGDGRLNKAEFFAFATALSEQGIARYGPNSPSYNEEEAGIMYEAINQLNTDNDGIVMPDMMRFGKTMKTIN